MSDIALNQDPCDSLIPPPRLNDDVGTSRSQQPHTEIYWATVQVLGISVGSTQWRVTAHLQSPLAAVALHGAVAECEPAVRV